ncbi:hypothetical protein AZZ96_002043, partial [Klebsiella pneumoniae]
CLFSVLQSYCSVSKYCLSGKINTP